jgi:hypothetical protein
VTGLLADLTRPELDALLADAEHADRKAHIALSVAPLGSPGAVYAAAGLAADCLGLWMEALDESLARWVNGEMP